MINSNTRILPSWADGIFCPNGKVTQIIDYKAIAPPKIKADKQ